MACVVVVAIFAVVVFAVAVVGGLVVVFSIVVRALAEYAVTGAWAFAPGFGAGAFVSICCRQCGGTQER